MIIEKKVYILITLRPQPFKHLNALNTFQKIYNTYRYYIFALKDNANVICLFEYKIYRRPNCNCIYECL